MYKEMVDYIESRIEELTKEMEEAKKNGDVVSARVAIMTMIELNRAEMYLNNLEIKRTRQKIEELIEKREESA